MLVAVFQDRVQVVALPDIHDPPRWVDHVLEITGPVGKVFGNDAQSVGLFEDADIPVRETGFFDRQKYEGAVIRMQMAEGDPTWRRAMPVAVAKVLDDLGATKRIRLLEAHL